MPDLDDPRIDRAMTEMERDMEHLDENNPKHMAHMMKKMKDLMPPGHVPKELDIAIKRLEAGEDPEKIEADMGDVLGDFMGGEEGGAGGGGYTTTAGFMIIEWRGNASLCVLNARPPKARRARRLFSSTA